MGVDNRQTNASAKPLANTDDVTIAIAKPHYSAASDHLWISAQRHKSTTLWLHAQLLVLHLLLQATRLPAQAILDRF